MCCFKCLRIHRDLHFLPHPLPTRPSADLCVTGPGKLSGAIAVDDGKPSLRGPITLARVACAQSGFSLESASVQLALEVGRDLSSLTGKGDRKSTRMNSSH